MLWPSMEPFCAIAEMLQQPKTAVSRSRWKRAKDFISSMCGKEIDLKPPPASRSLWIDSHRNVYRKCVLAETRALPVFIRSSPGELSAAVGMPPTVEFEESVNTKLQESDCLMLFSLEGVEIVVFAYILVFLRNRYTNGSEQLPVLLGPQGD